MNSHSDSGSSWMHLHVKILFFAIVASLLLSGLLSAASAQEATKQRTVPAFSPPSESPKEYSAGEIGAMFERPTTVHQLLQNLKFAMDRDLLLQRAFYEDQNLLKFFNGSAVTWQKPDPIDPSDKHKHRGEITLSRAVFPGAVANVIDNRWQDSRYVASTKTYVPGRHRVVGTILLKVEDTTRFTAHEVTDVFGDPSWKEFDIGLLTHGYTQAPIDKGKFVYEIRWDASHGSYFEKRMLVYFKRDPPPDPLLPEPRRAFRDDDSVSRIELVEKE